MFSVVKFSHELPHRKDVGIFQEVAHLFDEYLEENDYWCGNLFEMEDDSKDGEFSVLFFHPHCLNMMMNSEDFLEPIDEVV